MKIVATFALLLIATAACDAMPPVREFASVDEIRKWAAEESFGGSQVDVVSDGDAQVAIVRRSHTSGVQSCSLSVFSKDESRWIEALSLAPVWGAWLDYVQTEDAVSVKVGKDHREVLRFSISELQPHHRIE